MRQKKKFIKTVHEIIEKPILRSIHLQNLQNDKEFNLSKRNLFVRKSACFKLKDDTLDTKLIESNEINDAWKNNEVVKTSVYYRRSSIYRSGEKKNRVLKKHLIIYLNDELLIEKLVDLMKAGKIFFVFHKKCPIKFKLC